ncbi:hypothetical protein CIB48_g1123 [Xylaria polymorpha]|nr:hypothetical protein CIB48_g1123 [Xylaria polymorpha]
MSLSPEEADARLQARKQIPKPKPAYLPTTGSPLNVDENLYSQIRDAPRLKSGEFVIPIRSGRAWKAEAGCIIRISTPEGPQVDDAFDQNDHDMRPLVTILSDTLSWYGVDEHGGRVHDLLGTGCDPYINAVLTSGEDSGDLNKHYDFHCRSNLTRAVLPYGLTEHDIHDVINLFQVTGLDEEGRYFMNPCPAGPGDYIEFLAEQDILMALSTCPGGDLSLWGFGAASEKEMVKCCRPLKVEVFHLQDTDLLKRGGWKPAEPSTYRGMHGMMVPEGEHQAKS